MPIKPQNLTGHRFGRLVAMSYIPGATSQDGHKTTGKWLCQCDCGNTTSVVTMSLRNKDTASCGCYRREVTSRRSKTHGHRSHPLFGVWATMRARCHNPTSISYRRYGARGIAVCDQWRTSFQNFWDDMSDGWEHGLTIERIDNNGPYSKENCRWVTRYDQLRNYSRNVILETPDGPMILKDAAAHYGLKWTTVQARLKRGVTVMEALTAPLKR